METTSTTIEKWELHYAFNEYGSATAKCSSLEDCKRALAFYMKKAGKKPLWAKAVQEVVTTVTTEHDLS